MPLTRLPMHALQRHRWGADTMVETKTPRGATTNEVAGNVIPDLRGDVRPLVPPLGLRNYWYPCIPKNKIPKRHPLQVRMLGEELCFFRGAQGQAVAIRDICPHRGGRPSEGTCHWKGTVTCPYHGWTFDEHGVNVAVLSEGPDSKICGKPGTEATVFPTQELKGVVFVWIGDTKPAPIEEDVPEEFFDPKAHILYNDRISWRANWCQALENFFDAHPNYLHRDDIQWMLGSPRFIARATAEVCTPGYERNSLRVGVQRSSSPPPQDFYPSGWRWPKHRFRRLWAWLFLPIFSLTRVHAPEAKDSKWRAPALHPPGLVRVGPEYMPGTGRFRYGGGLLGRLTRWPVAVEAWQSRVWYFHYTQPTNRLQRMWYKLLYTVFYRFASQYIFSAQDGVVTPNQRWDWPEMLSPTDSGVVQYRRLMAVKHFGGRNAGLPQDGAARDAAQEAAVSERSST